MLIKNAHIFIGNGRELEKADLRFSQGLIREIGRNLTPRNGEEVYDASGQYLLPGLVDAHTHIGGMDFSRGQDKDDLNEMTAPLFAGAEAYYSIDPKSPDWETCRSLGITSVMVTPGSGNVLNGLASVVKTSGSNLKEMLIKKRAAFKVALGGNPTGTYGSRNQAPMTRMAIPSMIREFFSKVKDYQEAKEKATNEAGLPSYNPHYEAGLLVLNKEIPLKIHCTQHDIPTAIELAQELEVDFTLDHVWGGSDYMEELIAAKAGICFGPMGSLINPGEARQIDPEILIDLDKSGLTCAIISDSPIIAVDSLIQHAGEAVRQGLDSRRAIVMLTENPAILLGINDQVGTIELGKRADLCVYSGIPSLDVGAVCLRTWQDGKLVFARGN